jgi:hypothetical protein
MSRIVKGIHLPVTENHKSFTARKEAAREDIKQAFGVAAGTVSGYDTAISKPFSL